MFTLLYRLFTKLPPVKKLHNIIAIRILAEHLHPILEVGSGNGGLIHHLAKEESNIDVVGIEPSLKMIRSSKKLSASPRIHLIRATGEELPIRSSAAGVLAYVFSYHHLNDARKSLEKSFESIKENGVIMVFEADASLDEHNAKPLYKTIGLHGPLATITHKYLSKTGHAVDPKEVKQLATEIDPNIECHIEQRVGNTPISLVKITRAPSKRP